VAVVDQLILNDNVAGRVVNAYSAGYMISNNIAFNQIV